MQSRRVHRWLGSVALTLTLALAGCSDSSTSNPQGRAGGAGGVVGEPQAAQAATASQSTPAASGGAGQFGGAQPVGLNQGQAAAAPDAAIQQVEAQSQVIYSVYQRVGPVVVRIETGQGLGSGWLFDTNGHIVTNNHVIENAQGGRVLVSFSGPFQTLGTVVGTDPDSDIAVLKVDELPQGVQPVQLGDSAQARVGDQTVAIGNPLGKDRTVTTGIISAIGRTIDESTAEQQGPSYAIGGAIQTDAAINPGNSGGPLLNVRGQLIGMNTAILSRSGTSSGIGFAVPVNLIKKVVPALIQQGEYSHPYLGVEIGSQPITTYEAKRQNLPGTGVVIRPGSSDSPVARAGIRSEVILHAINGVEVSSSDDVISYLEVNTSAGDQVTLTVFDGSGQTRDVQVTLGARPRSEGLVP